MNKYHAIAISRFYLDRKIWCVKWLSVEYTENGQEYWFVRRVTDLDRSYVKVRDIAFRYSDNIGLPVFSDIRKGMKVTDNQKLELQKYGVTV